MVQVVFFFLNFPSSLQFEYFFWVTTCLGVNTVPGARCLTGANPYNSFEFSGSPLTYLGIRAGPQDVCNEGDMQFCA